jgi:hypothetical protein
MREYPGLALCRAMQIFWTAKMQVRALPLPLERFPDRFGIPVRAFTVIAVRLGNQSRIDAGIQRRVGQRE